MHTRSRWVLGLALAATAIAPWLLVSDASGQPVDPRALEPNVVRVEIESLEAIRGVRFVGPIVQTVQPAGAGEKVQSSASGAASYWTNWNKDTLAISGSLPAPAALSAWLEASFEGRLATKNVSVITLDTYARELWRWRFTDCVPAQMAYDVDTSTWTLRLSFARMRYQSAAVEPDVPLPQRSDERVAVSGTAFLKLTLAKGTAIEATRIEGSDVDGQVVVTQRKSGRVTLPWSDIKSVELATELPPPPR